MPRFGQHVHKKSRILFPNLDLLSRVPHDRDTFEEHLPHAPPLPNQSFDLQKASHIDARDVGTRISNSFLSTVHGYGLLFGLFWSCADDFYSRPTAVIKYED